MIQESMGVVDQISLDVGKGYQDRLGVIGHVKLELFGPDGVLKEVQEIDNTVTTAGKTDACAQIAAVPAAAKWGWIAVGTGTPQTTLLGAEIARVAFSSNTSATNVCTVVATFAAGTGTGILTEAGTFNIATANTVDMWTSATINITKGASDTLTVTWTLTYN